MSRHRPPLRPDEHRPRQPSRPDQETERERVDRLARAYVEDLERVHSSRPPPQDPTARAIFDMEERVVGVVRGLSTRVDSLSRSRESMREFGFEISDTGSFKVVDERSLDATLLRKELAEAKEKLAAKEAELATIHADEKKNLEKWGDRRFELVVKVAFGVIAAMFAGLVSLLGYVWAHIPH